MLHILRNVGCKKKTKNVRAVPLWYPGSTPPPSNPAETLDPPCSRGSASSFFPAFGAELSMGLRFDMLGDRGLDRLTDGLLH